MAKDARGHGSDARGGFSARMDAARANPNHPLGALVRAVSGSGGPFVAGIQDASAARELAQGNPKGSPPAVHPAMGDASLRGSPGTSGRNLNAYRQLWQAVNRNPLKLAGMA